MGHDGGRTRSPTDDSAPELMATLKKVRSAEKIHQQLDSFRFEHKADRRQSIVRSIETNRDPAPLEQERRGASRRPSSLD
jgi:hypothetical protein